MAKNKLIFLDSKDPEFLVAYSHFADPVMRNDGEVLQYMGTVIGETGYSHHEFRHRCDPETNNRRYWKHPASTRFHARVNAGEFNHIEAVEVRF